MEPKYEFEISVDGKVVWKGMNPEKAYNEIRKKYPSKILGVAWRSKYDVLVFSVDYLN